MSADVSGILKKYLAVLFEVILPPALGLSTIRPILALISFWIHFCLSYLSCNELILLVCSLRDSCG